MENTGAKVEEGTHSENGMNIGGRLGAGGEGLEGVLAISEDDSFVERVEAGSKEESLKTEPDSVDFAEIVSAMTKGGTEEEVKALIGTSLRDENEDTGT